MIYLRALGAYWNEYSRSNSELIMRGEGIKTSELLCNELWRINTGNMENSGTQEIHSCIHALIRTIDLM